MLYSNIISIIEKRGSSIKLTKEEINITKEEINRRKIDIKDKTQIIKSQKVRLKEIEKAHSLISRKSSRTTSLMGEVKNEFHDGIQVWNPEEELLIENESETIEPNENE